MCSYPSLGCSSCSLWYGPLSFWHFGQGKSSNGKAFHKYCFRYSSQQSVRSVQYYPHLTDEKIEARGGTSEPGLSVGASDSGSAAFLIPSTLPALHPKASISVPTVPCRAELPPSKPVKQRLQRGEGLFLFLDLIVDTPDSLSVTPTNTEAR